MKYWENCIHSQKFIAIAILAQEYTNFSLIAIVEVLLLEAIRTETWVSFSGMRAPPELVSGGDYCMLK